MSGGGVRGHVGVEEGRGDCSTGKLPLFQQLGKEWHKMAGVQPALVPGNVIMRDGFDSEVVEKC